MILLIVFDRVMLKANMVLICLQTSSIYILHEEGLILVLFHKAVLLSLSAFSASMMRLCSFLPWNIFQVEIYHSQSCYDDLQSF